MDYGNVVTRGPRARTDTHREGAPSRGGVICDSVGSKLPCLFRMRVRAIGRRATELRTISVPTITRPTYAQFH